MVAFIDQEKGHYGVEPICRVLPIASSTYYAAKAQATDPSKRSARMQRDAVLCDQIRRVWTDHREVYGARKVWRQLGREQIPMARCTVERLMRQLEIQGVRRGAGGVRTTIPDAAAARPLDLVQRAFTAARPNRLWVSDFTYVATWRGFVYTSFVIDVFSRRIVGWRVASTMQSTLVLDALEQAIWERLPASDDAPELIHHSDRGS